MITANKKISFRAKFTGFFLIAALAITLIAPIDNAYAQTGNQGNTGNQNTGNQTTAQSGETCAIEKIGWILCPIMEGVAKAADKTYEVLANNFLQIEPELLTANPEGGKGTITAWEYARNLANIAFIIAFLVVIYSQVTGAGLNNYGIKRMLPRLIIAAIAVNISYYICQAMVDLSNILGYEVKGALTSVANQIGPAVMGADTQGTNTQTGSGTLGTLSKITIAVLAVAAVVWIFVGLMGSIGLLILITVVTIIIILLLRKAFIVILVVLSPLAFVAYLLPNTEKLFSKWLNMFWQLLMVFPIVALLFGGGQLASTVILVAGSGANSAQSSQQNCSAGSTPNVPQSNNGYTVPCEETVEIGSGNNKKPAGWMLGLVAAGIAIAPLLFVWSVLKGALAAAGAIGGKLAGAIQDASKGKRDTLKKKYRDDREDARGRQALRAMQNPYGFSNIASGGQHRRKAFRDARRSNVNSELKRQTDQEVSRKIQDSPMFSNRMAGGGLIAQADPNALQRTMDRAQFTIDKVEAEEVDAASAQITELGLNGNQLKELRENGSYTDGNGQNVAASENMRKAALKKAVSEQDIGAIEDALKSANTSPDLKRYIGRHIEQNFGAIKQKGAHLTEPDTLDHLRAGGAVDDAYLNTQMNSAMGKMSAELMATQKGVSLGRINTNVTAGSTNAGAAKNTARTLRSNTQIFGKVGASDRSTVMNIAR